MRVMRDSAGAAHLPIQPVVADLEDGLPIRARQLRRRSQHQFSGSRFGAAAEDARCVSVGFSSSIPSWLTRPSPDTLATRASCCGITNCGRCSRIWNCCAIAKASRSIPRKSRPGARLRWRAESDRMAASDVQVGGRRYRPEGAARSPLSPDRAPDARRQRNRRRRRLRRLDRARRRERGCARRCSSPARTGSAPSSRSPSRPAATTRSASTVSRCASMTSSATMRDRSFSSTTSAAAGSTRATALAIVEGIARGCALAGASLVGGETAQMPGLYKPGEYDLAGFAVGAAERSAIPRPAAMRAGDVLIGLASTGLHSNGFSLVRKVLLERGKLKLEHADRRARMHAGGRTAAAHPDLRQTRGRAVRSLRHQGPRQYHRRRHPGESAADHAGARARGASPRELADAGDIRANREARQNRSARDGPDLQ